MALGASPLHILRMVAGEAALLTGIALALGLAGALASTRLLGSVLYGVHANDPASLIATGATIAVVAMIACAVPAWRAMRVDPVTALHYE
jgi:ABC-type antimicrobial peptide transport system permease subunit